MAKNRYPTECPEWGPCDGHHYVNEDTGQYRPFCDCGQQDPAHQDRRTPVRVPAGPDEPPF